MTSSLSFNMADRARRITDIESSTSGRSGDLTDTDTETDTETRTDRQTDDDDDDERMNFNVA